MVHELKISTEYFSDVKRRVKQFEIRKNDRNYQVGDILHLKEYSYAHEYTGRQVNVKIIYMTNYQQKDDYVVLGIRLLKNNSSKKKDDRTLLEMMVDAEEKYREY